MPDPRDPLPPPDVPDPVVDAYKKDVDRTLLIEALRLTPQERLRKFQQFLRSWNAIRGTAASPEGSE